MTDPRSRLTGRLADTLFTTLTIPRVEESVLDRLRGVPDTSAAVADALDELGAGACVASAELSPLTHGDGVVVGQAVTLRYRRLDGDVSTNRAAGRGRVFGDRDVYGLASPGDVAVVDCGGATDAAVVGALSARWARKAGVAACLVDGPVRDTASIRETRLPVWSRGARPQSARYRLEVAELNGPVDLAEATVRPGDVVVADDDGIAVIPFALVEQVVQWCEQGVRDEERLIAVIDAAADLSVLVSRTAGPGTPA